MGCFSDLDMDRQEQFESWEDRSYPSRRETLGWILEDLADELEERGVSVVQLALDTPNGLADYYEPSARVRYFDAADEADRENLSTHDLIAALGEVAHYLKTECGVTHDLELRATAKARPAGIARPIPAVA